MTLPPEFTRATAMPINPCTGAPGATPHWTCIAANPPGHASPQVLMAQGAKGRSRQADPSGQSTNQTTRTREGYRGVMSSQLKALDYALNPIQAPAYVRTRLARVIPIDPDEYKVRLKKIGYDIYYGGGGSYLYQPICKNACTTIKTILLEVEGLPVDDNWWQRHQKEYNGFPGTDHLPLEKQLDVFEGRTDTFKFVFVRNPYARLASAFIDKIRKNVAPHIVKKIRASAARVGVALSEPITFSQFVNVVCRQSLAEMDQHCSPQFHAGRFRFIDFDFIGRMESLDSDLTYVLERIGADESIFARAHFRHNETGSSVELWDTVPSDVRLLFLKIFGIDFDVLQYPRRIPGLRP
jgi:hypothetical protein